MTSDESELDGSSRQSTDPSSETESVEDGQPNENVDAETDGDAVESAQTEGDSSDANDNAAADGSDADDNAAADDNTEDGQVDPGSISRIERMLMDPEQIIDAVAYNGQEDIGRKEKTVFWLGPPFDETVEPTLKHLEEDSTKHETDDEIRLRPLRFVVDGRRVLEQRPTRKLAVEKLDADAPDDATIEAWIDEAMDTWKAHVRDALTDSVDIFSPHGMTIVNVEYENDSE